MPTVVNITAPPVAVQGVAAPGYGAIDLRRIMSLSFREGVFAGSDFQVAQRGGGAAMAVDVGAGEAVVQGDYVVRQGLYQTVMETAATGANELTISAAHATLPRLDTIILAIQDNQYDGSGFNRAQLRVLTGTPTAGANRDNRLGAAVVPSSAMPLADIEVAAVAATIVTANIVDLRTLAADKAEVGDVRASAGSTAASQVGWAKVRAQDLSRTRFATLFSALGTVHGGGNGSTTFTMPDPRGRTIIATGQGAGLTNRTMGTALASKPGDETIALTTPELPVHDHPPSTSPYKFVGSDVTSSTGVATPGTGFTPQATMNRTGPEGGGVAHKNMQPSITFDVWVYHGMAWTEV